MDGVLNTQYAVTVDANLDVGVSGEGAIGIGISGSDGGVLDSTGLNLIVADGVPVNYGVVLPPNSGTGLSVHGSTTFDPDSNNGTASSQTWTIGAGIGAGEAGVTLANATDWVIYGDQGKQYTAVQIPILNNKFYEKARDKINRLMK